MVLRLSRWFLTDHEGLPMDMKRYPVLNEMANEHHGYCAPNYLQRALDSLVIFKETETLYKKSILTQNLCELRNLINVGYLIIKNAQKMRESRGLPRWTTQA